MGKNDILKIFSVSWLYLHRCSFPSHISLNLKLISKNIPRNPICWKYPSAVDISEDLGAIGRVHITHQGATNFKAQNCNFYFEKCVSLPAYGASHVVLVVKKKC